MKRNILIIGFLISVAVNLFASDTTGTAYKAAYKVGYTMRLFFPIALFASLAYVAYRYYTKWKAKK